MELFVRMNIINQMILWASIDKTVSKNEIKNAFT